MKVLFLDGPIGGLSLGIPGFIYMPNDPVEVFIYDHRGTPHQTSFVASAIPGVLVCSFCSGLNKRNLRKSSRDNKIVVHIFVSVRSSADKRPVRREVPVRLDISEIHDCAST